MVVSVLRPTDWLHSFRPFDVIMNLLSAADLCFIESVQKRLWLEIIAKPLIDLWEAVKTVPDRLASEYRSLWEALQEDNDFYYLLAKNHHE